MLVFNNQLRSGYEEICSYSPSYYPAIKEMDAIFRFAGWTLDLMADDLEKVIAYQFINYMNDETLRRFERFMGILPNNMSIEERKIIAYAAWTRTGKLSKTKIIAIVNTFVDCECQVSLNGSILVINMLIDDIQLKYINNIREMLQKSIPAHLSFLMSSEFGTAFGIKVSYENRMRLNSTFYPRYNIPIMLLDGTWNLDGAFYINGYRSSLRLDFYPSNLTIKDYLKAHIDVGTELSIPGAVSISSGTQSFLESETFVSVLQKSDRKMKLYSDVTNIPRSEANLTVEKDLWYMDGIEYMDGNRKLDAEIINYEL